MEEDEAQEDPTPLAQLGVESNLGRKQDLEMVAPEGLRNEFEGGEFDEFEQDDVLRLSYSGEETDSDVQRCDTAVHG